MKSTITQLYDYKQAQIPEKHRLWRIKDEEIRQQLEILSRDCARLEDAEEVRSLDAVQCRGESAVERWNRGNLLFYPGRGLCEADLENACLGRKVGETFTAAIEGGEVTLTVERIVRPVVPLVNDKLVRLNGPEGVETVEDYYRWYREKNGPERKDNAMGHIVFMLLQKIAANSVFALDEEEKNTWCSEEGKRLYDIWTAAGMDLTVPDDGTEFLTEEQALAKVQAKQEPRFLEYVASAYLIEHMGGQSPEQVYKDYLKKVIEDLDIPEGVDPVEFAEREGRTMLCAMAYMGAAAELLAPYARNLLEE